MGQQVHMIYLSHHFLEHFIKILQPMDMLDLAHLSGRLLVQFCSFPYSNVLIGFCEEQHLAMLWFFCVRKQQQNGRLLIHPRQPE